MVTRISAVFEARPVAADRESNADRGYRVELKYQISQLEGQMKKLAFALVLLASPASAGGLHGGGYHGGGYHGGAHFAGSHGYRTFAGYHGNRGRPLAYGYRYRGHYPYRHYYYGYPDYWGGYYGNGAAVAGVALGIRGGVLTGISGY
jgi:hypothetical protein